MTQTPNTLSPTDYARSVVAVPPIALMSDGTVAREANRDLMAHVADGGIRTLLYGGNANLYHYGTAMLREALAVLTEGQPEGTTLVFSIGPDFGKAMDQVEDMRRAGITNVMMLPMAFPADPRGIAEGVRRIADKLGAGLVLYIKREQQVDAIDVGRMVEEGAVSFVKYAVERSTPREDAYLDALIAAVGRERIASGYGETPILDHIGKRRMSTFTSGAVCIAPAASNALLQRLRAGSDVSRALEPFLEFERQRARIGGTKVLHDGITMTGLADCGPQLPFVSSLTDEEFEAIRPSVNALMAAEMEARKEHAAA